MDAIFTQYQYNDDKTIGGYSLKEFVENNQTLYLGFSDEEYNFRQLLIRKYSITADTDINALVTSIRNNIRGVIANTETDAEKWNQPEIAYNAVYPYNHVFESESGHIKEYDDTAGNERIHERHISGTSTEMTANGDRIDIIKNNHYTLTSNNNKAFIQ